MSQPRSKYNILTGDSLLALLVVQSKVSSQRLLARVQLCSFCIIQGNCEYVYTAQNSAGSRMAMRGWHCKLPHQKSNSFAYERHYIILGKCCHCYGYTISDDLGQVSCSVLYPICICYTSMFPRTVFLPHLLVRRNLGVPYIHNGFLKKMKFPYLQLLNFHSALE